MTEFSVNQPVIWQVRVGERCVEKHGFVSRLEGSDRDAIQIRVKSGANGDKTIETWVTKANVLPDSSVPVEAIPEFRATVDDGF